MIVYLHYFQETPDQKTNKSSLYSFDPIWSTLIAGKIIDRHVVDM